MFEAWKKRRKLDKEVADFDQFYAPQFRAAKTEDDRYAVRSVYDVETAEAVSELRWMQTAKLIKRGKKYGVKPPPHNLETGEAPYWERNKFTERSYLSDEGEAKLIEDTNEARFVYLERRAKLLVPILSLLVAILALLKSGCLATR